MYKNKFLIKELELLPTNSRIIFSTSYVLPEDQPYSQLNKNYHLTPSELAVHTISEDELDFGEKGFVTIEFYKTTTTDEYSNLTKEFYDKNILVVETFLYNGTNKNELYLTSDWSDVPEDSDTIEYSNLSNNPFVQIAIFCDKELTNFKCVINN